MSSASMERGLRLPAIHGWLLALSLAGALLWRVVPGLPGWAPALLVPLLLPWRRRPPGMLRLGGAGLLLFLWIHAGGREDSRPPCTRPAGPLQGSADEALLLVPRRGAGEELAELRAAGGGADLRRPLPCAAWAWRDGEWHPLPGRLDLWAHARRCPPLRGTGAWLVTRRPGRSEALWEGYRPPLAPHAPDRGGLAWARGRVGRLTLDTARVSIRVPAAAPSPAPPGRLARLRSACVDRLLEGSGQGGPWLAAILLGETSGLPEHDVKVWQRTGLAHLLAVSGLNVGVLALTLHHLLGPLPVSAGLRSALLSGLLVLYVPLAGGEVSVRRAVGMALLLLVSRRLGRPLGMFSVLALAASLALWLDPGELARPGFQLSYGAVAGLLLGARGSGSAAGGWLRRGRALLADALRTGLAAQAGTMLTQLACFGALPLSGIALNLVAVPLGSALTVAGFLHLLLPLPGEPIGAACDALSRWLVVLARRAPLASLDWDPHPLQLALAGAALAALLAPTPRPLRRRWRWATAGLLALAAADLLPSLQGRRAAVCLLDMGQGDAIWLRDPAGRQVLVDAGWADPRDPLPRGRELARALGRLDDRPVEWLVLTHPDQDHLGGVEGLLETRRVERILWNGEWKPNPPQDRLRGRLRQLGTPMVEARPGQILGAAPGWRIHVLGPPPPAPGREGNERSVVLRVQAPRDTLLLAGDMGLEEEERLAGWGHWWRAGILKVGHHGSRGGSGAAWLAGVKPREAWLSCGRGNRYGHPHQELLDRLAASGVRPHRTDRQGWQWRWLEGPPGRPPPRSWPRPRLRLAPPAGDPA